MRIFDPEVLVRSFQQLGFEGHLLNEWNTLTSHSHGIILVTGPTGSGKNDYAVFNFKAAGDRRGQCLYH